MKWVNKGLIYHTSATTPTPILIDKNTIRVFFGERDTHGVSRIHAVDVDAANPGHILKKSQKPVLNLGAPGTFDDNGIILGDVVRYMGTLRMYYVGFQKTPNVKFLAFSGLAISNNNGRTFTRIQETPILDRAPDARYIRAIHSVLRLNNTWHFWFTEGDTWRSKNGALYPCYTMFYASSTDGIHLAHKQPLAIARKKTEYRIGRPRVYYADNHYHLFFTSGHTNGTYTSGYAVSTNGIVWKRNDSPLRSLHAIYPTYIDTAFGTYLFYDSPNFGASGFGYAILATK